MATRSATSPKRRKHKQYDYNVFINCPFDDQYKPLLQAMVFAIHHANFIARCAQETSSQKYRLKRILDIIGECRYGIHDVSRSVSGRKPRNNMPLELGTFIGCQYFGAKYDVEKEYLILDTKKHEYQKYLSDLSGEDISAHDDTPAGVIQCVRDWLSERIPAGETLPGADHVYKLYQLFLKRKEEFCERYKYNFEKLLFTEYVRIVVEFLEEGQQGRLMAERAYERLAEVEL